jgi:hypothetical protein
VINGKSISIEQNPSMRFMPRRKFISMAAASGAGLASLNAHDRLARGAEGPGEAIEHLAASDGESMAEEIKNEKIRRAMLAGPSTVTGEATVAEMDHQGNLTVLRPGKYDWVCIPGD